MTTLKASKKNGQTIIARAKYNEVFQLFDVYGSYSIYKSRAWNDCYNMYLETDNHHNFHICSHNCNFFTVAWEGTENEEPILRMETAYNSYKVYLNK